MSVWKYLRNPIYITRRLWLKIYELRYPDHPWISQGAIKFLDKNLRPQMKGFEWGSGRSTFWFGKRSQELTSIEYSEEWYQKLNEMLKSEFLPNVTLKHTPLCHPKSEPTYPVYEAIPKYVSEIENFSDDYFDYVLVDGHYRQACIRAALKKIKPGGWLIVDNSNRVSRKDWGVPEDYELLHQSENVMTETSIWKKPD